MPARHRPRRSALYIPGSNERAIAKAPSIDADIIIFDLEDSVAPPDKEKARDAVAAAAGALAGGAREIVVRINGLDTPWISRDIAVIAAAKPDALLVPKIERTDDIRRARAAVSAARTPSALALWAMIETPAAVLNVAAIAAIAAIPEPSVTGFVVGTNDLAAELGVVPTPGRAVLLPYLAQIVLAARAHRLTVLDGTFNNLEDEVGLDAECRQGRTMGMDGKTLIHPAQVAAANIAFAPAAADVAWARRVVEAFALPENKDAEVIRLGGRMVERLHERAARRLIDVAETIATVGARTTT